jgi:hypothetical protein
MLTTEHQGIEPETGATSRDASRVLRFIVWLPFVIAFGIVRAAVYSAWYLAFFILCMFRPFTGFLMLTAIVMVPMAIVLSAHPDAANGLPSLAFGLMAIGLVAFAIGFTIFLDWFTPPGATDPFARYRRSDR